MSKAINILNTSQSTTLSGELTNTLRDAIITGQITQGSRLSETKLSKEMNVSRGPLREAIRRLEGMKLITHIPQQGVRVVTLSPKFILDIYETRESLEGTAAKLAAMHMTSSEVDNMYRLIDSQSKHLKESASAVMPAENDYAFHYMIIEGSKNKVLQHLLLEELYYLIKMFRYQDSSASVSNHNALTEHRHIAYAIEQRNPLLAEVTMRQHIVNAKKKIKTRLEKSVAA